MGCRGAVSHGERTAFLRKLDTHLDGVWPARGTLGAQERRRLSHSGKDLSVGHPHAPLLHRRVLHALDPGMRLFSNPDFQMIRAHPIGIVLGLGRFPLDLHKRPAPRDHGEKGRIACETVAERHESVPFRPVDDSRATLDGMACPSATRVARIAVGERDVRNGYPPHDARPSVVRS